MLTLRLALPQTDPKNAKALVEAIKRQKGSCDNVWLTTIGYYPSLETHRRYVESWKESARIFREAGLHIGINIANTVGHREWPYLLTDAGHEYIEGMEQTNGCHDTMVGPDGTENTTCFCWNSERLQQYVCALLSLYAKELPIERFWFDDDLRANSHFPVTFGCFCERCIGKFNQLHNVNFTRGALVHEMNYGDTAWRRRYIEFCRKGIYDFTYKAAKAILKVSPAATFGLEYGHWQNYTKSDENFILDALHDASGRPVETRPGGGYYNDKAPWDQYRKAYDLSFINAQVPAYVEKTVAELENLPGAAFGKSLGGIINEGTLDLAVGCTALSFTDLQSMHEPMAYYEQLLERFSAVRPYWERLRAVSREHIRGGVGIVTPKDQYLRPLGADEEPFDWINMLEEKDLCLLRLGVPLTHDMRAPAVYLLHQYAVDALSEEEIAFLLTRPVLADGEAVAKLIARGYGEYFPFATKKVTEPLVQEHFTDHPANAPQQDAYFAENSYANKPMQKYTFTDMDETVEVLGEMRTNPYLQSGDLVGPATILATINTPQKPRWAVFGYSVWNDIVNSAKREQILGALDAIGSMPARLRSIEQAVVIPSVDAAGNTVCVTVSAASQSGTAPLTLAVRAPKGERVTLFGMRREQETPAFTMTSDNEMEISLPALQPYETVTVFLD